MAISPLFNQLFSRSPVAPMQEHMKVAAQAATEVQGYMAAVMAGDWDLATTLGKHINDLEDEADDIKRKIRLSLPRSLFMPVSRSDLLELLQAQDRIANLAKHIVGLTSSRRMSIPAALAPAMEALVEAAVKPANVALEALNELDELITTGFSGKEVELVSAMISRLDAVEHAADIKEAELTRLLYSLEKSLDPVDVMFLYRLIEWIGDLADKSQTVGNRMLYLIAR
ncbi:TIGR00153 family protein [Pseudomonadales bacterium]|nr:TIGR00153 family protein [Pseudomonadales bacterium]MDB9879541.1 TIGR00153 family protein [Pseudomonadales bacterium]MDC1306966.1 TIGR00153 family protein [Pseudomonadales bacterium]